MLKLFGAWAGCHGADALGLISGLALIMELVTL